MKDKDFYRHLIQRMPLAYAYQKVLLNSRGEPWDCECIEANQAFGDLTGWHLRELPGKRAAELLGKEKDDSSWIEAHVKTALQEGSSNAEYFSFPLGIWFRMHSYSPEPGYLVSLFYDISREKRETREKEALLLLMHDMIFEFDENRIFTKIISGKNVELFLPPGEALGKSLFQLFPSLSEPLARAFEEARKTGRATMEYMSPLAEDRRWFEAEIHYLEEKPSHRFVASVRNVTAKKRQETALAASEEKWKSYVENAPYGVFVVDHTGRYLEVNPEASRITGYTREELCSMSIVNLLPPEERSFGARHFEKVLREGSAYGEGQFYSKSGECHWWSIYARKLSENRAIGFCRDITENREAQEALNRERAFLRQVIDIIPGFVFVKNSEGYHTLANKTLCEAYGKPVEQIEGHRDEEHAPTSEEIRRFLRDDRWVLEHKKPLRVPEERITYGDGSIHWHETIKVPMVEEDGSCTRILGVGLDITDRKELRERLRRGRERLELALNAANAGLWDWDVSTGEVYFDSRYYTMAGYEANIFPQAFEEWEKRVHPEDRKDCARILERTFRSRESRGFDMEFRFLRGDGEWMWIRGYGRVVERDARGEVCRLVGLHTDVSERRNMEDLLHMEKTRFQTTLLSIGDGVLATDGEGKIILMNRMAEQLTGYSEREALGKPLEDIFRVLQEETRKPCRDLASRVLASGEVVRLGNAMVLVARNGRETCIEDSAAPIRDARGDITGVVVVCSDVTERKERQKEIEYLSSHDHLTGLFNRRYLEKKMEELDTEGNLPLGMVVVDVNGLKLTNDAFGHKMGDRLLQITGNILGRAVHPREIVGRMGGDEFLLLLPRGGSERAEEILEALREEVSKVILDSVILSLAMGYAVKTKENQNLEELHVQAENAMYKDKLKYGKIMRSQTVERVLSHINVRYDREQIHTERVAEYCEALARALKWEEHEVEMVKTAAVLHDIGKIMVPLELLNKEEPLSKEEFDIIRRHPETGYEILKSVEEYAALAEYVLYHHERWDGGGYPEGLAGEDIPLVSRIISVADAYEAMTAQRPYQRTKTRKEAMDELERCGGTQFDPRLVQVFLEKVLFKQSSL